MAKEVNRQPHESEWQFRSRMIAREQQRRALDEPILPDEARRHGDYADGFVMHVETGTLAKAPRKRDAHPLTRLLANGAIDHMQFDAALRIANIVRRIGLSTDARSSNPEPRVDCSGSTHSALIEKLGLVKDEIAYTRWRHKLPTPRAMILDMIVLEQPLVRTARHHGVSYPIARARLIASLDLWCALRSKVAGELDGMDLARMHGGA